MATNVNPYYEQEKLKLLNIDDLHTLNAEVLKAIKREEVMNATRVFLTIKDLQHLIVEREGG